MTLSRGTGEEFFTRRLSGLSDPWKADLEDDSRVPVSKVHCVCATVLFTETGIQKERCVFHFSFCEEEGVNVKSDGYKAKACNSCS